MPENAAAEGGFGRDAPDRSRDTDNNRGGAREDKESRAQKAESFDRAMDNANRPDRAPAAPANTTTASDDDDDDKKTDKTEDRPDSAAGPPGIGAPPSTSSPTDTAEEPEEDDPSDERGLLDRITDALTAPPTDAEGNARSTSQVADRINNVQNYSLGDLRNALFDDPGLTPGQSEALADGAAVMEGAASDIAEQSFIGMVGSLAVGAFRGAVTGGARGVAAVTVPAGVMSQLDSPAPGPADVAALGTLAAGALIGGAIGAVDGMLSFNQRHSVPIKDLEPLHDAETSGKRPELEGLSDDELIDSAENPKNDDPVKVNPETGKVIDGNGRVRELQDRAKDPDSRITPETEITVEDYKPDYSDFWDLQ